MTGGYTDTPFNITEILPYVITDQKSIISEIFEKQKCCFYDACSFRRHANLKQNEAEYIFKYINARNGIVVITRCILMELSSHSGSLNQEYVAYIRHMNEFGIPVLLIFEEDLFAVMEIAFSTNAAINGYLCWAVRTVKNPVSTITKMLEQNLNIKNEVIKGKNLNQEGVYRRFFEAARRYKESGDDLGEELLAICVHILSHIPGEEDGKFCIITDDKGAAGKIDALFKKTAMQHRGKNIILYSTPKLVQVMVREHILTNKKDIKEILNTGINGNMVVLGMLIFDIRSREISVDCEQLAELIMQPNGIHIIF